MAAFNFRYCLIVSQTTKTLNLPLKTAEEIDFQIGNIRIFWGSVTLTLTFDDLESHVVNGKSTSTIITNRFVATLCSIVNVWTYVMTDGRMDRHFHPFIIRSKSNDGLKTQDSYLARTNDYCYGRIVTVTKGDIFILCYRRSTPKMNPWTVRGKSMSPILKHLAKISDVTICEKSRIFFSESYWGCNMLILNIGFIFAQMQICLDTVFRSKVNFHRDMWSNLLPSWKLSPNL